MSNCFPQVHYRLSDVAQGPAGAAAATSTRERTSSTSLRRYTAARPSSTATGRPASPAPGGSLPSKPPPPLSDRRRDELQYNYWRPAGPLRYERMFLARLSIIIEMLSMCSQQRTEFIDLRENDQTCLILVCNGCTANSAATNDMMSRRHKSQLRSKDAMSLKEKGCSGSESTAESTEISVEVFSNLGRDTGHRWS